MLASSRSIVTFGRFVREWWSGPVDYVAQMQYFANRGMAGAVQVLIGLGTGLNGVISLAVLLPSAGTAASRIVVALFAALQLFWAWSWCSRPWPSRHMFAMLSVYLVFFEGPKTLAAHTV